MSSDLEWHTGFALWAIALCLIVRFIRELTLPIHVFIDVVLRLVVTVVVAKAAVAITGAVVVDVVE